MGRNRRVNVLVNCLCDVFLQVAYLIPNVVSGNAHIFGISNALASQFFRGADANRHDGGLLDYVLPDPVSDKMRGSVDQEVGIFG